MNKTMIVVGTRPEIVKMAPIVRALEQNDVPMVFAHCGQHYDYNMSQQFIEDLGLPELDYSFKLKAYPQAMQTAKIMIHMSSLLKRVAPSLTLVEGDTNSVLATALAAVKSGISIGHVEAGLRSFDLRMPEEHNRRLTDHISNYLFAPTKKAQDNLKKENVWGKTYVVGNTVIDAVIQHLPIAERKSEILKNIHFERFALATAHRAENVDNPKVLLNLVEAFDEAPLPIVYPVHPRTRMRLKQIGVHKKLAKSSNIQLLSPLGYLDFLILMKNCDMIITDSGGIQEEATAPPIRKPVLVIRLSTERPEAVEAGFARVVGTEKGQILKVMEETLLKPRKLPLESPYGNGNAAQEIVRIIRKEILV
jgi:UDP-N-acetylglucosamine 2-epimerase (non-hydrolysing)